MIVLATPQCCNPSIDVKLKYCPISTVKMTTNMSPTNGLTKRSWINNAMEISTMNSPTDKMAYFLWNPNFIARIIPAPMTTILRPYCKQQSYHKLHADSVGARLSVHSIEQQAASA